MGFTKKTILPLKASYMISIVEGKMVNLQCESTVNYECMDIVFLISYRFCFN
jgi:hypothetical protein